MNNIINKFGVSSEQLKKGVKILRKMDRYGGVDYDPPLVFESFCVGREWDDFGSRILLVNDSKRQNYDKRIDDIVSVTTDARAIYFDDVMEIV